MMLAESTLQRFVSDMFVNIRIIMMALQPFVGPWPFLQFLDPIHNR
jgi:hypothetical protein